MTTKRLAILLVVLLGGMGSVAFLPAQLGYQPVGIKLDLPEYLGQWRGKDVEVTQKEHDTLGYDTEFARKTYVGNSGVNVLASIVLAGQDMMTGIHRPERCLNAQGWNVGPSEPQVVDLAELGRLHTTRLLNTRKIRRDDGSTFELRSICYYWFVGYTAVAASHGERVWIDSRDRILKGYNQRWGMVLVNADITKDFDSRGYDEAGTDALLQAFVQKMAPRIIGDTVHLR